MAAEDKTDLMEKLETRRVDEACITLPRAQEPAANDDDDNDSILGGGLWV